MNKLLSFKVTSIATITIYVALLIFHLSLIIFAGILSIIPYDIVWGGRMGTQGQLIFFELLSFLIIALCLFLTLVKSKIIKINKIAHYAMWLFFAYFLLNTFGNILSKTIFEKSFAVVSILLSLLSLRLALEKEVE